MKPKHVRLFTKTYCGWCDEAKDWFKERGIPFEELNVSSNSAARQEMFELTGQTRAPSMEVDGHVLADFGTDELEEFWKEQGFD